MTLRVAIVGGTGLAGRHAASALSRAGHECVVIARSRGVDALTGEGLDAALTGVDAVVDVMNVRSTDAATIRSHFGTATKNLLAAERRARVKHHVLLSIVGADRFETNAHISGKREQEALLASSPVPVTIQRATQFYEFAEMMIGWTRRGDAAHLPPLLVQPVAASDVGAALAEVATGAPQGRAVDLAGPEPQDLVDMARRILAARGRTLRLVPTWRGPFGVEASGEALLPGPEVRVAPTTFDEWLEAQATTPTSSREVSRATRQGF